MSDFNKPLKLVHSPHFFAVSIGSILVAAVSLGVVIGLLIPRSVDNEPDAVGSTAVEAPDETPRMIFGEPLEFAATLDDCPSGVWHHFSDGNLYYDQDRNFFTNPNTEVTHKNPPSHCDAIKRTGSGFVFRTTNNRFPYADRLEDNDPLRNALVAVRIENVRR